MLEKIDVREIVRRHIETLRDASRQGEGLSWPDVALFFGVPALVPMAFFLFSKKQVFTEGGVSLLVNLIAILTGFLLNVLVLIVGQQDKTHPDRGDLRRALEEVHHNVAFAVLVGVVSLVPLALVGLDNLQRLVPAVLFSLIALGLYLVGIFFLTMLMVMKRVHGLLAFMLKTD